MTYLALSGGAWIFLAFLVMVPFGIAIGWYTRTGSGIEQRPAGKGQGPAGAAGSSRISAAEDPDRTIPRTPGTR